MKKVFDFLYTNEKYKKYIIYTLIALSGCIILCQSWAIFNNNQHQLLLKSLKYLRLIIGIVLLTYLTLDVINKKVKLDIFFFIFGACFVLNLIFAKTTFLITILIFVYLLKQYDFDDFIKYAFWFLLTFFVTTICLSAINILPNLVHSRGAITRYCLGLNNSTYSQNILAFIILTGIYIYKEKLSWFVILLEFCLSFLIYFLTNSRAAFFISVAILLIVCIVKIIAKFKKENYSKPVAESTYFRILVSFLPIVSIALFGTLVLLWPTQSAFIIKINELLSGRIQLTYAAFVNHGITPFGKNINWYSENGYVGVDNAYFNSIFTNGIVCTLIVILINCCLLSNSIKQKNYWLTFAVIVIMIDAFVEQSLLGFQFNLFTFATMNLRGKRESIMKEQNFKISQATLDKIKKIKLSIIVLCYNGEKYIKTAMENLLNQDPEINKEIIVINDGSTDNSLQLLQEYGDKIKIYSNEKQMGISYSRNIGIEKATGDYTANYDIDDLIEPNMFHDMLAKIVETDADICICDYDEVNEDGKFITNSKYSLNDDLGKDVFKNYLLDKIGPAWWNKVFKASFIKDKRFDTSLLIGEDLNFCLGVFSQNPKTVFVDKVLYHYTQRNTSIMHDLSAKHLHFLDIEKKDIYKNLVNKGNHAEELESFRLQMITRSIHSISSLCNKHTKKKVYEYLKSFCTKKNLKAIVKNKNLNLFTRIECFIMKTFGIKTHIALTPIYKKIRTIKRRMK